MKIIEKLQKSKGSIVRKNNLTSKWRTFGGQADFLWLAYGTLETHIIQESNDMRCQWNYLGVHEVFKKKSIKIVESKKNTLDLNLQT